MRVETTGGVSVSSHSQSRGEGMEIMPLEESKLSRGGNGQLRPPRLATTGETEHTMRSLVLLSARFDAVLSPSPSSSSSPSSSTSSPRSSSPRLVATTVDPANDTTYAVTHNVTDGQDADHSFDVYRLESPSSSAASVEVRPSACHSLPPQALTLNLPAALSPHLLHLASAPFLAFFLFLFFHLAASSRRLLPLPTRRRRTRDRTCERRGRAGLP